MVQVSRVPEWKIEKVEAIEEMALGHPIVALATLDKIRASQIHTLRKSLRGEVSLLVTKNNLMRRALRKLEEKKPKIGELADAIEGSTLFIFTEMNPFKLLLFLEKNKTMLTAKAGDIAPEDIVIPEGNTGMPPGPVISDFTEVGIRTKIEAGSVWVVQDTVVAKKGEPISLKLASVLSRLGVKPIESGLTLYAAYDDGTVILSDSLHIDVDVLKEELLQAGRDALTLAVFVWFPTPQNIQEILRKAADEARCLGVNSSFLDGDFISDLLRQAKREASLLERSVG